MGVRIIGVRSFFGEKRSDTNNPASADRGSPGAAPTVGDWEDRRTKRTGGLGRPLPEPAQAWSVNSLPSDSLATGHWPLFSRHSPLLLHLPLSWLACQAAHAWSRLTRSFRAGF